jgi:hypothetical protein
MPTEAQKRALSYGPQPDIAASSLRAPMRGEILPISVTTTSKRFAVPAAWKGSFVNIQADGGDVYVQVSTAADAACDIAARAQEAGSPIALTPSASGNGCFKIPDGQYLPVPFPQDAQTFALIASTACVARCHPSET